MARENPRDLSLRHVFSTQDQQFLPNERDGKSIVFVTKVDNSGLLD